MFRQQKRYGRNPHTVVRSKTTFRDPLKWREPRKVFVCSMADLFGAWVPKKWIEAVLEVVRATPQHTYQFLTKWPERLARWNPWPENAWVGASATNTITLADCLRGIKKVWALRFVSAEPWLGTQDLLNHLDGGRIPGLSDLDWLIVGQQTGPGAKEPDIESVNSLLHIADGAGVPTFIKPPLAKRYPDRVPQWPEVEG
jgi:protein gp37